VNANDESNEGIIHTWAPFLSVQFHPEACAGPRDTTFLFDEFLEFVTKKRSSHTLVPPIMYQVQTYRKCILIGSGGLSIGQAGEFDYSGSQAIKALKEEGIEVILINPNIATVQTSSNFADKVYFLPVTPEMVKSVIEKERPDSILVSMGGQTALNVGVSLYHDGTLEKYNVKVLGTPIPSIIETEDRKLFAMKLDEIGESLAKSISAYSVEEALKAAEKIGYPLLVRAAFALGGLGSGFANDAGELKELATKAFASSSQIILDEDLRGWKEVEYEVIRDGKDNCVTVCNMENFDPLGIHTGDSIVIAPSQTLSNAEYFKLREVAVKVVRKLGIVGECNIQYALCPHSEKYCIIEVNARLSRSSALASKATGYPLAYVAAKVALGKDLVLVRNSVTQTTTACFEPALDYCVAKVPRWDLKKFQRVSTKLGSSMKSIGEVMAIGRNFEEVIQKAVRMVDPSMSGWDSSPLEKKGQGNLGDLEAMLKNPTPLRLFALARAFEMDYSIDKLHSLTRIDRWFLSKLKIVHDTKVAIINQGSFYKIDASQMRLLKSRGFSDLAIAKLTNVDEVAVRRRRIHDLKVVPFVKQIDTLAAEFPAKTNYLYTTYNATESDLEGFEPGVIVLGNGPYCIGSSVEFDWCAVSCVRTLRKHNFPAVVVNCNPETVSTDYDESDRLYFEELTFERVMDIYDIEKAQGVVVSVGGQVANCMVMPLSRQGVRVFGTSPDSIDTAEDRNKFSALLDSIGVDQPEWCQAPDWQGADQFAQRVGYPVLVRPSYVLSGAAMRVAWNSVELREFLVNAAEVSTDYPVVVSKFIQGAKEVEFDAVAQNGQLVNYAISEHVENAGVHSGDATLVLPAQKLYVETIRRVTRIAGNIAAALKITGPFNIQFICKANLVKVIECNLRASRSFPFVSKTLQCNFIDLATRAMMDLPLRASNIKLLDLDYVGVKAPMFSFTRLQGADPTLGVEMASTGEVACFGKDVHEAFLLSVMSAGVKIPPPNKKTVLFAVGPPESKISLAPYAKVLQYLGYTLFGTEGTAEYFTKCGIEIKSVAKPPLSIAESAEAMLSKGEIALVINIPDAKNKSDISPGYKIRRAAVDFGVSLITNSSFAIRLIDALASIREIPCMDIKEIYELGEATSAFSKSTVNLLRREASSHGGSVVLSSSADGRKIDSLLTQAEIDVSVSQTGMNLSANPL
jgi:carbamoyl-phosphate synthase/aspartate carbamoyltransferase